MATIYLSSTYNDLKACREAVYRALRQMRHDVIAMEDYVATDQRPAEKCLADVAASDLYIGLFAWRYGYIPSEMNPEHKSITELEYCKATETGKTCLIFILDKDAPWPATAMDAVTGEGKRGKYITALRRELAQRKMVRFFKTPEELASLMSTAVSNWEKSRTPSFDLSNTSAFFPTEQAEKVKREARLKALLAGHSSFMQDRLNSFVGRVNELSEIRGRIAEKLQTGGYVTITGQAGQGKSSIIAKLVEIYQQEHGANKIAFHFIPFNPGPDHQVGLLRNLMARLITKYDLSDLYVASESRAALRDFFPRVLSEVVAREGREVIFIDGLDQLEEDPTGVRDLSFLPNNPPIGIVFVLGTRPNDTLKPLELLKPRHEYKLPDLSRQDFDRILQHREVHLETELADQFYDVMQANALYLDLVAKELRENEAIDPQKIITQIADNPENLFSFAMTRLKRPATEWREVIKTVLGLLLAAREPLSIQAIRQILSIEDDRLRDGITRLGGLLAVDGQHQYSLFHLKFYDYLRQDERNQAKEYVFATDEEERWHQKLAHWCEQKNISIIWQDAKHDPIEQKRRMYARQHYLVHLYHAKEWQRLFEVLDAGQYGQAKLNYDPSTRTYAQDLDLGRQTALWKEWTVEERLNLLPHLWRYTLLRCSLASRADHYSLSMFEVLMVQKREVEALGLAELLTDPLYKMRVLIQIAQQIRRESNRERDSVQLLMRACEGIQLIKSVKGGSSLIEQLCTALSQVRLWEQVKVVTSFIEDNHLRARTLKELSKDLSAAQQWKQAEAIAHSIEENTQKAEALSELGKSLALAQQWEWAKSVVYSIGVKDYKVRALVELSKDLSAAQQWEQAEAIAHSIEENTQKAEALSELGKSLALAQQWEWAEKVWTKAEVVISSMSRKEQQAEALGRLGISLALAQQWEWAEKVWTKAVSTTNSIEWDWGRSRASVELSVILSQVQQWEQAEKIARSIKIKEHRASALAMLGKSLTQAQQWRRAEKVWAEAESGATSVELSQILIQSQRWEQAESVIRSLNQTDREKMLEELGKALAHAQQWEKAEAIVISLNENRQKGEVLSELGKALAQAQQWEKAEAIIRSIEESWQRTEALRDLMKIFAYAQQWERVKTISNEVEKILPYEELSQRAKVLGELGKALAQAQQMRQAEAVWIEAEAVIHSIEGKDLREGALSELGKALAQAQQWERAEAVIRSIEDKGLRGRTLSELGKALAQAQQWEKANTVWDQIEAISSSIEVELLMELAIGLVQIHQWKRAESLWMQIEVRIRSAKELAQRAEALQKLSQALAQVQQYKRAEKLADSIDEWVYRSEALRELSRAYTRDQQWEQAKRLARLIDIQEERAEALMELGYALAHHQQQEQAKAIWVEAAAVAQSIWWDWEKARTICLLSKTLARVQQWEWAEKLARSIQLNRWRTEALAELGYAFALYQQWNQAKVIWIEAERVAHSIEENIEKARALSLLSKILVQTQQWEWAEEVVRSIPIRLERIEAMRKLGEVLIEAQQWERAVGLWTEAQVIIGETGDEVANHISFEEGDIEVRVKENRWREESLQKLANNLLGRGEYEHLLQMVQYMWLYANTRTYAINLLPVAFGLIALKPEIGTAFYETFAWVDNFLQE